MTLPDDNLPRDFPALGRPARLSPEDRDRLVQRIVAQGEPVLARYRGGRLWREELVALGRIAGPLALAAGLGALLVSARLETAASTNTVTPASAFFSALTGETTSAGLLDATLGSADSTWLLAGEAR